MKKLQIFFLCAMFSTMTALSEDAIFETITKALNYTGDKNAVTKLIITGTIAGNDYSKGSEWREFRFLNETFPNLEAVEIWTDQDIPDYSYDYDSSYVISLFLNVIWLKSFSAPNIKYIGKYAFYNCENLFYIDFPNAVTIGSTAFYRCKNLINADFFNVITIENRAFFECINLFSIEIPNVRTIDSLAFYYCKKLFSIEIPNIRIVGKRSFAYCESLMYAIFGTNFETETEIKFGTESFGGGDWGPYLTSNIELTLGEFVLPKPNIVNNTWQHPHSDNQKDYVWKMIKYYGIEEIINNLQVDIFPNPTTNFSTIKFELGSSCNIEIIMCDILGKEVVEIYNDFADAGTFTHSINAQYLLKGGIYFLKILIGKDYIVEKIIVN